MKKQYVNLVWIVFSILGGCNKPESDFVGNYTTMYSATVWWIGYSELDSIKLRIYKDEEGLMKGKGALHYMGNPAVNYHYGVPNKVTTFDLTDLKVKNDTLEFLLESENLRDFMELNRDTKYLRKKLRGVIVKSNRSISLGVDEKLLLAKNEESPYLIKEQSPYFLIKKAGLNFYNTNDQSKKTECRKFYDRQILSLQEQIGQEKHHWRKDLMETCLNELQKHSVQ